MGVGKTTTCQMLRDKLKGSVFLDGDWCLDMPSAGYFDDIVSHLNTGQCKIHLISLACSEQVLQEHLKKDIVRYPDIRLYPQIYQTYSYLTGG